MLHEVLLALSGHPSPLFLDDFEQGKQGKGSTNTPTPLLSHSEKDLLKSIGRLSELHRALRSHVDSIAKSHQSTICRAVAVSIRQTHLARFQKKIVDVEAKILTNDSTIVGAYDIVPLASIVGEFEDWSRRMEWYWEISNFMSRGPAAGERQAVQCSGAELIDKLRVQAKTGFPEIEQVASELSRVAETAWLRQLSSWLLHGQLPSLGGKDFFIRKDDSSEGQPATFKKNSNLLPSFVATTTASSIVFIGKSINQVRQYDLGDVLAKVRRPAMQRDQLASVHLKQLSALSLPLVPAQLSRAITAIRTSLSRNVLQYLLPMDDTLLLLSCLRKYFLLDDGEFAVALIAEAESRLLARQQSMGKLLQQDITKGLQGLSVKDSELSQTLIITWKSLAARNDNEEDIVFECARKTLSLGAPGKADSRPPSSDSTMVEPAKLTGVRFDDLLFPSPSAVSMAVAAPFDLFLAQSDVDTYSAINAYLISLRRAHLRLSDLWRRTVARRDHPAPPNPRFSSSESGKAKLATVRTRNKRRLAATRRIWATCTAAIFLLAEVAAYLEGEVINCSWSQFESWVTEPPEDDNAATLDDARDETSPEQTSQRDPETLAAGHRASLASLTYTLLLTDAPYTKELRALLGDIDQLIALFVRLLEVQQRLDEEADAGLPDDHHKEEEQKVALDLDRARKRVDSGLKAVTARLRQLDHERIGAGRYLDLQGETSGFEPWKGGGVDRLLMKLEFGRMRDDGYDIV